MIYWYPWKPQKLISNEYKWNYNSLWWNINIYIRNITNVLFHQEHAILFLSTTILLKQKFIFLFKIFCSSNSKKEEQGRIEEEKKHAMLEKKKLDQERLEREVKRSVWKKNAWLIITLSFFTDVWSSVHVYLYKKKITIWDFCERSTRIH